MLCLCSINSSIEHSTVWNRDINACRNMAIIFLSIVSLQGRPHRFCHPRDLLEKQALLLALEEAGGGSDGDGERENDQISINDSP